MKQRVLTAVAKWCLVRLARKGKLPVGLPGHRDPDSKCSLFTPPRPGKGINDDYWGFRECHTDGHYLCAKCIHNGANALENNLEEL